MKIVNFLKRILLTILVLTLSVCSVVLPEKSATAENSLPPLQIHMLDLGSACALLLISDDTVIMVDGGMNKTGDFVENRPLMEYLEKTVDHVDLHILTHYHNDHVMNFPEVNALYGTDTTVVCGPSDSLPERLVLTNGRYQRLTDGDSFSCGPFSLLTVGPPIKSKEITGESNGDSLNVIITYGSRKIFISGDYVFDSIVNRYPEEIRDMDVLVFPHHGLRPFYLSDIALKMMDPELILVPANTMGALKVHCEDRLGLRMPIYCSGGSGGIIVTVTPDDLTVSQADPR